MHSIPPQFVMLPLLIALRRGTGPSACWGGRSRGASLSATAAAGLRVPVLDGPARPDDSTIEVGFERPIFRAFGAERLQECEVAFVAIVGEQDISLERRQRQ